MKKNIDICWNSYPVFAAVVCACVCLTFFLSRVQCVYLPIYLYTYTYLYDVYLPLIWNEKWTYESMVDLARYNGLLFSAALEPKLRVHPYKSAHICLEKQI